MEKRSRRRNIMLVILGIFVVAAIATTVCFFRAEKKAQERFAEYETKAKSVETSYGKITYIDEGEGEVILSCHGLCGGYDQAYDTLKDETDNYRVIAPSRFGYPGSDAPENPSVENQVEAFVELLDTLEIDQVYVLATSAGGATAIKFTLMYPERTKGLILYCSGYPTLEEPEDEVTYVGPPAFICSDFPMWFFSPLFGPVMGMDRDTIEMIMPLKERKEGIVIDAKVSNTVMYNHREDYDMRTLEVPVLCFHAKDDKLADYNGAKPWEERIPDCTFISFETGGHLMVGNGEVIQKELAKFVERTR
ncbi:MAG: alpha/beta fold hydrolase [Roseburia sp.]